LLTGRFRLGSQYKTLAGSCGKGEVGEKDFPVRRKSGKTHSFDRSYHDLPVKLYHKKNILARI